MRSIGTTPRAINLYKLASTLLILVSCNKPKSPLLHSQQYQKEICHPLLPVFRRTYTSGCCVFGTVSFEKAPPYAEQKEQRIAMMFNNGATRDPWGNLTSPEPPFQTVPPPTAACLGQGSKYESTYDCSLLG